MPPRATLLLALLTVCLPAAGCTATPAPTTAGTPPSSPRLTRVRSADGVELAVEERGPRDAQAIVLVHGLAFSREIWHRQMEGVLASRYHLVVYDLRGHGRSSRPSAAAAYEDGARWADDLRAVLDATRATNPVVVGWSLGGVVIVNYLRRYGDGALGGAVFVDAVTKFSAELFAPDNGRYIERLVAPDDARRRVATADSLVPASRNRRRTRSWTGSSVPPAYSLRASTWRSSTCPSRAATRRCAPSTSPRLSSMAHTTPSSPTRWRDTRWSSSLVRGSRSTSRPGTHRSWTRRGASRRPHALRGRRRRQFAGSSPARSLARLPECVSVGEELFGRGDGDCPADPADATLRAWVDAIAPGVRDELARRVAGARGRLAEPATFETHDEVTSEAPAGIDMNKGSRSLLCG